MEPAVLELVPPVIVEVQAEGLTEEHEGIDVHGGAKDLCHVVEHLGVKPNAGEGEDGPND